VSYADRELVGHALDRITELTTEDCIAPVTFPGATCSYEIMTWMHDTEAGTWTVKFGEARERRIPRG